VAGATLFLIMESTPTFSSPDTRDKKPGRGWRGGGGGANHGVFMIAALRIHGKSATYRNKIKNCARFEVSEAEKFCTATFLSTGTYPGKGKCPEIFYPNIV
jgi:hypothetical protein